jgi:hypothetical protein
MATYYVRTDGSNANTGTGPAANQAWQTVTYALANATLTSGVNTIYIAPGVYRETPTVTVTPSSTQTLEIVGNASASQFSGVNVGPIRITNYLNDNTNPSSAVVFTCAKTYVTLRDISFVMFGYANFTNAEYITIDKCLFETIIGGSTNTMRLVANGTTPINATITKSIFIGQYALNICGPTAGTTFNFNVSISDCFFMGNRTILIDSSSSQFTGTGGNGITVYNSTFYCVEGIGLFTTNTTNTSTIRNCNFIGNGVQSVGITGASASFTSNFNRFSTNVTTAGAIAGANSLVGSTGIDWSGSLIHFDLPTAIFAPGANSPLINAGTSTGAPVTDIYSDAWTSGTDVGAFARTPLSGTSFYFPTERNASTITIAPASTSQSIELYLGATGLTFATSGLAAYFVRNREAPTPITLVTQTPTGTWASGGFAEIDSSAVPGVYRLDVPDAAFVSGSDDVTIVVRGASGTNGAVVTIRLNQLSVSQILNTQAGIYTSAGTLGARLLQTVSDNRPVIVTSDNQIQVDAGQTFSSGSGTTILSPILNSVGRWTLEGSTLTLYNADGTYLRRVNLTQLGLSLSPT